MLYVVSLGVDLEYAVKCFAYIGTVADKVARQLYTNEAACKDAQITAALVVQEQLRASLLW